MPTGTWNNMDESPKHYARYDNSDSKSYVLYDISVTQHSGKGEIIAA